MKVKESSGWQNYILFVMSIITLFAYEYGTRVFIFQSNPLPTTEAWISEFIGIFILALWLKSFLRRSIVSYGIALLIPVVYLFFFDVYIEVFNDTPKIHQLSLYVIFHSWSELPLLYTGILSGAILSVILFMEYKVKSLLYFISLPISFWLGAYLFSFNYDENHPYSVDGYRNSFSYNSEGRLKIMFLDQVKNEYQKKMLTNAKENLWNEHYDQEKEKLLSNKNEDSSLPNIYLIVLESFVDMKNLQVDEMHIKYQDGYKGKIQREMGSALSPIVGGGSVNAEFELLCGAPSLKLVDMWDFTLLKEMENPNCMIGALKEMGYSMVMNHGGMPYEFDSGYIYPKLKFDHQFYTTTKFYTGEYENPNPNYHISDLELFMQMLEKSDELNHEGPVINYMLGKFGHYPFDMDENRYRKTTNIPSLSTDMNKILNQEYHRQNFILKMIEALEIKDPDAIVLIIGDHTPPNNQANKNWVKNAYEVPLLMKDKDGWKHYKDIPIFNLYKFIFDSVSKGKFCEGECKIMPREAAIAEELYFSFFSKLSM